MSNLLAIVPLAVAAAFAQAAGAQQPSKGGDQQTSVTAPVSVATTRTITGTIESIDTSERRVVLKGEDGSMATVVMGPQVKDFANLKKGDSVTVRYSEAIALALAKGDQKDLGPLRQRVEADAVRQSPPGGKPGVSAMERTTLVANVFDVDRNAGTLTLRGTSGVPVQMRVQDKKTLEGIKKNDQVVVSYVEAAALSVERGSGQVAGSGKAQDSRSSVAASGGEGQGGSSSAASGTKSGATGSNAKAPSANQEPGSPASATRATGSPGQSPSPGQPGAK